MNIPVDAVNSAQLAQVADSGLSLTPMEQAALEFLSTHGGSVLVTAIPDKNDKGMFGEKIAGMPVYKKLDKRGLVVLTEEPIEEDGFQFTSTAELTDAGNTALAQTNELERQRRAIGR